ncbi:MAG: hypothetical protein LBT05_12350 [Planctomycetaceae bacterium]|jgi:hypothetical protein|nr:hypothetical protein [Planctomycetaceae bacterium]
MENKHFSDAQLQTYYEKLLTDQRRVAAIEKIGGGKFADLEAKAIEEGWAVEKFHAEYQHRTMPDATQFQKTNTNVLKTSALEAIALSSGGCSSVYLESQFDEKT